MWEEYIANCHKNTQTIRNESLALSPSTTLMVLLVRIKVSHITRGKQFRIVR